MQPTAYYQDDLVTLYHGDALELTDWLHADVLVTDPPYGMSYVSNASKYGSTQPIAGDDTTDLRDTLLHMWQNHDPNGDEGGPDHDLRPALIFGRWDVPRPVATRHRLIWDKGDSPGMGDLRLPWGPGDEEVYVIGTGFAGKRRTNVIRCAGYAANDARRPNHPTPKPVALMEQLLTYCPGGVIADPCAGSGATLIAARNLGKPVIAVELEERHCETIANRLSQGAFDFGMDLG